ncbi:ARS-binding protein 1-like [Humulus lupulus]|uniref:ARS-binding protein 1-like n=1 Tax=Humulus lupulus TaxID=3486 RepID=UPI002B40CA2D|nr:ARS-binding protein 1-like [Humulus lupulus]
MNGSKSSSNGMQFITFDVLKSGSVDMEKIEVVLPQIKEESEKWSLKDIFNMDETGLFYRMQADNSLATKNILLILDNFTAHGKKENYPPLRHTKAMFLPPNSTSKIQPCDMGIIRKFKGYYRQRFNRQLLKQIDDHVLEPSKLSVLNGIVNAIVAWSIDVKPQIIANCFKHCKIWSLDVDELQVDKEMENENKLVIANLGKQIKELHYTNRMAINDFLNHSGEQQVTYALSEEESLL